MSAVRFSVILPLIEDRGFALEALAGWRGQQNFSADKLEIVAVTSRADGSVERAIQGLLRPGSRVLVAPGVNRSRLFDLGCRAARGEFVFLTESHCIPAPDCLAELDRYLQGHDVAGACVQSVGIADDFLGREDRDMFEAGFQEFQRPGDWRKVNVHGFALRRSTYAEVGGLRHEYFGFAEMLLAAALRDRGHVLGFAGRARVEHHYHGSFAETGALIDFFVHGEALYRQAHPGADLVGYTFLEERLPKRSKPVAHLWDMLWRGLRQHPDHQRDAWQACSAAWRYRLLGPRGRRRWAWFRQFLARLRCSFWIGNQERRKAAYAEWIRWRTRYAERRWPIRAPKVAAPQPLHPIAHFAAHDLVGFHSMEKWQGVPFRWSGPLAALHLQAPAGARFLRVHTGGIPYQSNNSSLRLILDGRPLASNEVKFASSSFTVSLPTVLQEAAPRSVGWYCDAICPWKQGVADHRELGVPVFAVEACA